jgi:recombination protein RecA
MEPVVLAVDRTRRHALASRRFVLDDPVLVGHLVPAGGRPSAGPRTATGLGPLDALLDGGFPRGQLVELVGPRTSGRTRVLLGTLASVTGRGAWAALIDGTDALDPASAEALGVPLGQLLWVRCGGRLVTAWRAADVLVQSGGFEMVAIDLGDLPAWALARTPPAVFVRLQRAVERTATGLLVAGPRRVAGSLAAVAVALVPWAVHWASGGPGLLAGIETEARLVRSRTRAPGAGARLTWSALEPSQARPSVDVAPSRMAARGAP